MSAIFSFALQKGGAGKTTTVLSLASILAHMGKKVLCIDIDPQFNLTQGLSVDISQVDYSVYEVLLNPEKGASFAILSTPIGVDLMVNEYSDYEPATRRSGSPDSKREVT